VTGLPRKDLTQRAQRKKKGVQGAVVPDASLEALWLRVRSSLENLTQGCQATKKASDPGDL